MIDNLRVSAALFVAVLAAAGASALLRQRTATGLRAGLAAPPPVFAVFIILVLVASLALIGWLLVNAIN